MRQKTLKRLLHLRELLFDCCYFQLMKKIFLLETVIWKLLLNKISIKKDILREHLPIEKGQECEA